MILERDLVDDGTNSDPAKNNDEPVIKKRKTTDEANDVTIVEPDNFNEDENTWIELARYCFKKLFKTGSITKFFQMY